MSVLLKAPALLAAALSCVSAAPAQDTQPTRVPRVMCHLTDNNYRSGSAVRIGPSLLITARHVVDNPNCEIEGRPLNIFYRSDKSDFAMIRDDREAGFVKVDCDGFKDGHIYIAVGHARGLDELTVVSLIATGTYEEGLAVLLGIFEVQPGQSGGAILDGDTMKVVGIVNAADWSQGKSYSVELKSTSICGGRDA